MKTKTSLKEKSIQFLKKHCRAYPLTLAIIISLFSLGLNGCGKDCSEEAKMGDFEFSQGNFKNAVKHYERALKIASPCGKVLEKMESAKLKVGAGQ